MLFICDFTWYSSVMEQKTTAQKRRAKSKTNKKALASKVRGFLSSKDLDQKLLGFANRSIDQIVERFEKSAGVDFRGDIAKQLAVKILKKANLVKKSLKAKETVKKAAFAKKRGANKAAAHSKVARSAKAALRKAATIKKVAVKKKVTKKKVTKKKTTKKKSPSTKSKAKKS